MIQILLIEKPYEQPLSLLMVLPQVPAHVSKYNEQTSGPQSLRGQSGKYSDD